METHGVFAPDTIDEARERYEEVGPTAQVVVRETAKAMSFDAAEYDERVTEAVVETARDAIFAELLEVHAADRATFDEWLADYEAFSTDDVELLGSKDVDNVVWHVAPAADSVIAATYQNEKRAAIGTLRRNAFGRIYRDKLAADR